MSELAPIVRCAADRRSRRTTAARSRSCRAAFFGHRDPVAAERTAAFPYQPTAAALAAWFGQAAALRLGGGCRHLPRRARSRHRRDRRAARRTARRDPAPSAAAAAGGHVARLAWLAGGHDPADRLKIKLLNLAWAEICRDLERAVEFDQSQLFRKIYERRVRHARRRAVRAAGGRPRGAPPPDARGARR